MVSAISAYSGAASAIQSASAAQALFSTRPKDTVTKTDDAAAAAKSPAISKANSLSGSGKAQLSVDIVAQLNQFLAENPLTSAGSATDQPANSGPPPGPPPGGPPPGGGAGGPPPGGPPPGGPPPGTQPPQGAQPATANAEEATDPTKAFADLLRASASQTAAQTARANPYTVAAQGRDASVSAASFLL